MSDSTSGCSGASVMNVTPNTVSGRVVNTLMSPSPDSSGNVISRAHGLADPVALHTEHAVRPAALELGEVGEQFVGVIRDLEEPLGEFLLDDGRVAAPAQAVDDLLVGEHGIAVRAPVLGGFLAVDEALFQPAQEEKLLPAAVGLIAGGDFAVPVIGITAGASTGRACCRYWRASRRSDGCYA